MTKYFVVFIATALLSMMVASVYAQAPGVPDPGDPPPFNWEEATINPDFDNFSRDTYCDSDWCVVAFPPEEVDTWDTTSVGCWNSEGAMCVVSSNSDLATTWLADYAAYQAANGPSVCRSLDEYCPFFLEGFVVGAPPDDDDGDDVPPSSPPRPIAAHCPTPTITQSKLEVKGRLLDPPFPIVVGQDSSRRGADLEWRVVIPPVIHTWYSERTDRSCIHVGSSGSGCNDNRADDYEPYMRHNAVYDMDERVICIRHVDIYAERLNWIHVTANLASQSRDWILTGGLQQRYPGAHLYQPDWGWNPPVLGTVLGDRTFVWEWQSLRTPFRDPGQYTMSAQGGTTGTPVTAPRFFDEGAGDFSVWLHEATLTK